MSEEEMFYCSLCEVEVFKYNKHCLICEKCVGSFDPHCRAVCTLLAMIATLPHWLNFYFFHILLIKKGISTYDYIIALREQEQEQQGVGGQQSPQMSIASSLTGLSSASSFTTFHRNAWFTPPRLFLEDHVICLISIITASSHNHLHFPYRYGLKLVFVPY